MVTTLHIESEMHSIEDFSKTFGNAGNAGNFCTGGCPDLQLLHFLSSSLVLFHMSNFRMDVLIQG